MRKATRKLALRAETVARLELGTVRGGAAIITDTDPTSGGGTVGGTFTVLNCSVGCSNLHTACRPCA